MGRCFSRTTSVFVRPDASAPSPLEELSLVVRVVLRSAWPRPTEHTDGMDDDIVLLSRDQLVAEVLQLRGAIREHRDSSGHDLCWHHPDLWGTLPESVAPDIAVPPWPQFLRGCVAYRQSLDRDLPDAPPSAAEFDDPGR